MGCLASCDPHRSTSLRQSSVLTLRPGSCCTKAICRSLPQLWVIPPALCVFAACQFFKDRLTTPQLASIRYASIGSIYVASTSEIFLQGIAKAPWLPIVLAVFSILGILFGIAARIRSMLWLGSMFLAVSMFSILWYAAVDLEQTWLWYVCGILLGAMMLFVFGLFEKRQEELKKVITGIQTWEE